MHFSCYIIQCTIDSKFDKQTALKTESHPEQRIEPRSHTQNYYTHSGSQDVFEKKTKTLEEGVTSRRETQTQKTC